MTRRLYPLLPVFALIALTLLVFWKLAFTDLILARGDTYYYFYPLWAARDAALRAGELPLWTTQVFMGAPLLADPQLGTLYPPNWLTLRLDPPDAIRVSVLLHVTWAAVGAYALARRALPLDVVPAVITGAIFGFGGVIGAHVEQINQLQGLAWLPWALLIFDRAPAQPLRYTPLLAVVLALQFLSGHTQTVFITGVGLGVYALAAVLFPDNTAARHARARHAVPLPPASGEGEAHSTGIHNQSLSRQRGRIGGGVISLLILIAAVLLTGLLSAAQLIPTLELTGLSNRVDFNPQQAMAFSWNPLLAGRGLLPSYDAQVFGEYVAYIGVSGLALALIGVFAGGDRRRWRWVLLAGIGIGFAFGLYNPLYWTLAGLPGFNLFRVPARWLALFAISAALLTGCGVQTLLGRPVRLRRWVMGVIVVIIALIAASTLLADRAALEVDGPAQPGLLTLIAWAGPLLVVLLIAGLRPRLDPRGVMIGLAALVVGELWFASLAMPYNDLAHPEVYYDARLSIRQLQAYQAALPDCGENPANVQDQGDPSGRPYCLPGRVLSISNGYFDPGDKGNLQTRYAASGMTDRATRHALTAAKLKELVAPNFPLIWDVPSIDGAGGGLVPTTYYTQFSSLLLPEGLPRGIDGRLREMLALPACNGACLPAERWLDLTNTRYLLLDKTYDLVRDGIRYDTAFTLAPGDSFTPPTEFVGTGLHLLYTGDQPPRLTVNGITLTFTDAGTVGAFRLATAPLDSPQPLTRVEMSSADPAVRLHALTLVDTRTGDFMQVPLGAWRLALSSDIKLYENLDVLPRAFVVADTRYVPDTWQGIEAALTLMRDPGFDPRQTAILAGDAPSAAGRGDPPGRPAAVVPVRYTATEAVFQVDAPDGGTLVITDAAYPGWQATINGEPAPLYRADALFRGVVLPAGASEVRLIYASDWLPGAFVVSGMAWLLVIGVMVRWGLRARMVRGWQGDPASRPGRR